MSASFEFDLKRNEELDRKFAAESKEALKKEVAALRRALKSHGEIIEKYAALVLENQELKCKLELSQEL